MTARSSTAATHKLAKKILDLERETKLHILQTPVVYCSHYSKVDHCTQILESVINSLKISYFAIKKGLLLLLLQL